MGQAFNPMLMGGLQYLSNLNNHSLDPGDPRLNPLNNVQQSMMTAGAFKMKMDEAEQARKQQEALKKILNSGPANTKVTNYDDLISNLKQEVQKYKQIYAVTGDDTMLNRATTDLNDALMAKVKGKNDNLPAFMDYHKRLNEIETILQGDIDPLKRKQLERESANLVDKIAKEKTITGMTQYDQGLTNQLTNSLQARLDSIDSGATLIKDVIKEITDVPEAVGATGALRQGIGGIASQFGQDWLEDMLNSVNISRVRSKAIQLEGQLMPIILNENNKFSDQERAIVKEAVNVLKDTNSSRQALETLGSLETLFDETKKRTAQTLVKGLQINDQGTDDQLVQDPVLSKYIDKYIKDK